uniref:Acyl-CoA thioesterase 7 n=1 Tax=Chrysolophus pictus TaxID=9089 RepID=A0A8C3LIF4_CHRPC
MIEEAGAIISTRHCNSGQGVSGAGGVRRVRPFLRSVLRGQPCLAVLLRFETRREAWRRGQGRKAVPPRGSLRLPILSCAAAGGARSCAATLLLCAKNCCWKTFCVLCLCIREDPAALGAQRVLSLGSQGSLGCGGSVPSSSSFSSSAPCQVLPPSLHPDLVVLNPQEPCVAALARVERTDFLSPMCIGEVANVSAEITYTSKHSVEVQVNVMSENILTGAKKVTNKATLWYVPLSLKNVNKVVEVPPIQYMHKEQEDEGRKRYEEQKLDRLETKQRNGDVILPVINPEPHTVGYSQSSLIHLVGPSDCTLLGFVHGGVTMKLMDEVAGIVAARHCKTNIVTASVDAINFHEKIKKGEGWARLGHLCEPRWAPRCVVGRQSRKQPWGGWHPVPGRWHWASHPSVAPSALHTRAVCGTAAALRPQAASSPSPGA